MDRAGKEVKCKKWKLSVRSDLNKSTSNLDRSRVLEDKKKTQPKRNS